MFGKVWEKFKVRVKKTLVKQNYFKNLCYKNLVLKNCVEKTVLKYIIFFKEKTGFYRDLPGSRISEGNPGPVPDPGKFEKVNPGPGQIPGFSIPGPGSRFDPVPLPIPVSDSPGSNEIYVSSLT